MVNHLVLLVLINTRRETKTRNENKQTAPDGSVMLGNSPAFRRKIVVASATTLAAG